MHVGGKDERDPKPGGRPGGGPGRPGGRPGGGAEAATVASECKPGDFLGMLGISFRDVSTFFCLASLKPSMLVEVPSGEVTFYCPPFFFTWIFMPLNSFSISLSMQSLRFIAV